MGRDDDRPRPRMRRVLVAAVVVVIAAGITVGIHLLRGAHDTIVRTRPPSALATSSPPVKRAVHLTRHLRCTKQGRLQGDGLAAGETGRGQLDRFGAIAAVDCSDEEVRYPDGVWHVLALRVAVTSIGTLVTALNKPDGEDAGGDACAAYLDVSPQLALVDKAGRLLRPHFPRDSCRHIDFEAKSAARYLNWYSVTYTKVLLDVPNDPVRRACGTGWKNEIEQADSQRRYRPAGPLHLHGPTILCIYRRGDDPLDGEYLRGTRLDTARADALYRAMDLPGKPQTCPVPKEFAVAHTGRSITYIELGGCYRTLREPNLGRGDPVAVQRIIQP